MKNCDLGGAHWAAALFVWERGVARKPGGERMALIGGGRPRVRKASERDWTKAKAEAFLSVVAETCNVREACRRSGVSDAAAYRRRKSDAAFRAGWPEAISTAYQRLELASGTRVHRAEKVITRRDGSEERMVGLRAEGAAGACVQGQERSGGADSAEVRGGEGVLRRRVSGTGGGAWRDRTGGGGMTGLEGIPIPPTRWRGRSRA